MNKNLSLVTIAVVIILTSLPACGITEPPLTAPPPIPSPILTVPSPILTCQPADGSTLEYNQTASLRVVSTSAFTYEWDATMGTVNPKESQSTIYTAPSESGASVVSVKVSGNGLPIPTTLACTFNIVPPPTPTPSPDPIAFQKGVSFPSWWYEDYCLPKSGLIAIEDIAKLGAEWIQLIPTWYQENRTSNKMEASTEKTATDECLKRAIEFPHDNNLKIMLKPHVNSLDGTYPGEIAPSEPKVWFANYEKMLLHYADLAETSKVDLLVVGTEFKSLSESAYTEQWRALIAQVHQHYFNRLTYAANWDDYSQIEFWDALDYVGIDAYFPLSDSKDPSHEEILAAWQSYNYQGENRRWFSEIAMFAKSVNKPLIFTEIGYASQDSAAWQPWRWDNSTHPNFELQARLYDSALRTFWADPFFKGLYWWFWDLKPDPGYKETGYMPKDVALQELQRWYKFDPPSMPPTLAPVATPTASSTLVSTATPIAVIHLTAKPASTSIPQATQAPSPSPLRGYNWESCTADGWSAQTYTNSQGIASVTGVGDVAYADKCSLRLDSHLQAQHPNFSNGEAFVQLPKPTVFTGVTISCWVYVPAEATGLKDSPNGAQLFVKDNNFKSEYSIWENLTPPGWHQIKLAPTTYSDKVDYMDTSFDPGSVIMVGVKIGTGGQAPSDYSYNGPFYVDNCTW